MSILETLVRATEHVEEMNGINDALQKLLDADGVVETSAAASQLVAELAITTAVTATVRTSMSLTRLGLAITGQIWKWDAVSIDLNLNLDGDGDGDGDGDSIETVGVPSSGKPILFDHNADGVRTGTGWVKADDAWLVLDRNGNGTIDSGRELIGVDTQITNAEGLTTQDTDGFAALRVLDANGDGVFDANDTAFTQVQLGDAGNDRLDGGAGHDNLSGGEGNDTYVFGRGSGQDWITYYDSAAMRTDVIERGWHRG